MVEKMPDEFKGIARIEGEVNYWKTTPRKWTEQEIEWCLKLRKQGFSMEEIAESVDRSLTSVSIKLKRLSKKSNTYNEAHVLEKYECNKKFIEKLKPKSILDVYCGEISYYRNNFNISVVTNDKDENITADYHLDALKFLCQMYIEGRTFDVVDLDPYGSASECFDLAIKMAKKGIIITLGEIGHKRWKRLDYVRRHYDITSFDDFTTENLIKQIVKQGKKNKKLLTPYIVKDWQKISRVWFTIEPLRITEQWEK